MATFNIWGSTAINLSGQINSSEPTYAIIHGYQSTAGNVGNGYQPADWVRNIATTIRQRESNANIVLVDWEAEASSLFYPTAAGNARTVGNQLSNFLRNIGVDSASVNLIGHSLGAHVAGFAGAAYRGATGRSIAQIVGLDPAGPDFEGDPTGDRLDPSDATRVTAIHTSETLGYDARLGSLDLYINWNDLFQPGQISFVGNHGYAHTLYTELLQGYRFSQSDGSSLTLNTVVNAGNVGEKYVSTRDNTRGITAFSITGGTGNDTLAGGAGGDLIRGGSGNDAITGGDGNDSLYGDSGIDRLNGGRGNDSLFGGTGSDRLYGDEGNDVLTGADSVTGRGAGEIDRLTGGVGSDRFVLGVTGAVFYRDSSTTTSGTGDYALITDFNASQDFIQISGSKSSYSLGALTGGTGLYFNETTPELIAIIQGSTGLNLNSSYFVTV